MSCYHYGVQTALAYIFNHFFYNATHYVYLSGEYYPYRRKNPRSSNPHRIYEDIYEPWKDNDEFSKIINQNRLNIKNGVLAQETKKIINWSLAGRLRKLCDEMDVRMFYPIIYRIDVEKIHPKTRLQKAGSSLSGSLEYLIEDLAETDIDEMLFSDYRRDKLLNQLVRSEFQYYRKKGVQSISSSETLSLLQERSKKNVK